MRAKELIRYLAWCPCYEVFICGKLDEPKEHFGVRVDEERRRIYLKPWPEAEEEMSFRTLDRSVIDLEELGGKNDG